MTAAHDAWIRARPAPKPNVAGNARRQAGLAAAQGASCCGEEEAGMNRLPQPRYLSHRRRGIDRSLQMAPNTWATRDSPSYLITVKRDRS